MGESRSSIRDPRVNTVLLSLGANVGERSEAIARALVSIAASPGIDLVCTSSMYETAPVGFLDQPSFINSAALIQTTHLPEDLLARLRSIERELGRVERERWHEREIDIDILLYGNEVVDREDLHIPHRGMHLRRFVLVPANEIAPEMHHPVLERTVSELLARCVDTSSVSRVEDPSRKTSA